jgi:hypothetical protein
MASGDEILQATLGLGFVLWIIGGFVLSIYLSRNCHTFFPQSGGQSCTFDSIRFGYAAVPFLLLLISPVLFLISGFLLEAFPGKSQTGGRRRR